MKLTLALTFAAIFVATQALTVDVEFLKNNKPERAELDHDEKITDWNPRPQLNGKPQPNTPQASGRPQPLGPQSSQPDHKPSKFGSLIDTIADKFKPNRRSSESESESNSDESEQFQAPPKPSGMDVVLDAKPHIDDGPVDMVKGVVVPKPKYPNRRKQ